MLGGRGSTATETNITSLEAAPFRLELLRRGFTVLCPACGSDHWGGPESSRIALRVLEQLSSAGFPVAKPLPVMGFSMGGLGAMMFAARHPEWVLRLVGVFGGYDLPDIRRRVAAYRPGIDAVYPTPELLAEATPYTQIERLRQFPVRLFHGHGGRASALRILAAPLPDAESGWRRRHPHAGAWRRPQQRTAGSGERQSPGRIGQRCLFGRVSCTIG